MSVFNDLLTNFPPVVRIAILLMLAGAAYMVVLSLQSQLTTLAGQARRTV